MLRVALVGCGKIADAHAFDETKYPDWTGQWVRIGTGTFDPTKPPGPSNKTYVPEPITPEIPIEHGFDRGVADRVLAARAELGPDRCDRRFGIEQPSFDEHVRADGGDTLRRGVHEDERVLPPGRADRRIGFAG